MKIIRTLVRCLTPALLAAPLCLPAHADIPEWHHVKTDRHRHIELYLRQEEDHRLKSFKVVTDLETTPDAIFGVMTDFDNLCKWVYRCGEARMLKRLSSTEYQIYMVHNAPYGIEDRDTIIHGQAVRDAEHRSVIIRTWEEKAAMPDQPHRVRMINEELNWVFTANEDGKHIHLELVGYADPGGYIPRWIDNLVQLDAPYYSVRGLLRMLDDPKYHEASLPPDVRALWQGLL